VPAIIGVSDFHYAILTKDDKTGTTYQTPVPVPGLVEINIKPKSESAILYADNGPAETATSLGEVEVDINLADLPLDTQAILLGHTIANGVLVRKSTDSAPYVAIGFKSLKSNGKSRFTWLYKGRFELPEMANKTKEDKVDFQTAKATAKFVKREYDNAWMKQADEDAERYTETTGANWFTAVDPAQTGS
jgi:phi13 family phage major tail protein